MDHESEFSYRHTKQAQEERERMKDRLILVVIGGVMAIGAVQMVIALLR